MGRTDDNKILTIFVFRPSNGLLRPVAAELLAQLMQASSAGPQPQHPFAGAPSSQAPFSAIAQNAQAQQQTISAQGEY